jgi:1-acyl-sn-glycerol-3-phosphate acyltransferase
VIRYLLFALFFYPMTAIAVLIAIPTALVSRGALFAVTVLWSRYFTWCVAVLLGIRARVEGEIPTHPVLVAAKHQSMFETLALVVLLGAPATIVKQELGKIPLWGWVARRYGVIPVDRAGGATALRQMVKNARAEVAQGRALVIYPEGTRVPPGEQPPLQPGFAGLYRALGLPVVPVAVDTGRFWLRRRFAKRPGIATIRFGEPIRTGLPRDEIEARVHAAINVLE